jgi:hypothetical protein
MHPEKMESCMRLCEKAAHEQDVEKFLALLVEITTLLASKQRAVSHSIQ